MYCQPGGSEMAYLFFFFFLTWWLFLSTTSVHTDNRSEEAKVLQDGEADLIKAHKYGTESMVFKYRQGSSSMLQLKSFLLWKRRSHSFTLLPTLSSWSRSLFFLHYSSSLPILAVQSFLLTTLYYHRQALDCKVN